jgi:hypothetical protein
VEGPAAQPRFSDDELADWVTAQRDHAGGSDAGPHLLESKLNFYLDHGQPRIDSVAAAVEHYNLLLAVDQNEEDPGNLERLYREQQQQQQQQQQQRQQQQQQNEEVALVDIVSGPSVSEPAAEMPVLILRRRINGVRRAHSPKDWSATEQSIGLLAASSGFDAIQVVFERLVDSQPLSRTGHIHVHVPWVTRRRLRNDTRAAGTDIFCFG